MFSRFSKSKHTTSETLDQRMQRENTFRCYLIIAPLVLCWSSGLILVHGIWKPRILLENRKYVAFVMRCKACKCRGVYFKTKWEAWPPLKDY